MNTQRLANIIVSPRISEKATMRADLENQHVFSVLKDATKPEVKKAVELMFDVKVKSVRLMNVQGKLTRIGTQSVSAVVCHVSSVHYGASSSKCRLDLSIERRSGQHSVG